MLLPRYALTLLHAMLLELVTTMEKRPRSGLQARMTCIQPGPYGISICLLDLLLLFEYFRSIDVLSRVPLEIDILLFTMVTI